MRGVKGFSELLNLDEFDPVKMTPVEIMHTIDMGITKYFLNMWTSPTKHLGRWKISKETIQKIEDAFVNIRVPHYITRRPNFASRNDWKAIGK